MADRTRIFWLLPRPSGHLTPLHRPDKPLFQGRLKANLGRQPVSASGLVAFFVASELPFDTGRQQRYVDVRGLGGHASIVDNHRAWRQVGSLTVVGICPYEPIAWEDALTCSHRGMEDHRVCQACLVVSMLPEDCP